MTAVLSVKQIRTAEANLFKTTPERDVMLRAATALGTTCARLLQETRGGVYGANVSLLIGAGNNGGDALFAGALLAKRGAQVVAVPVADQLHADGLAALKAAGGSVAVADDAEATICASDLVIDGLVGIGMAGELKEKAAWLADAANDTDALVIAVDVPSGVNADTGQVLGEAVLADVTVTFGALKRGLLLPPGSQYVGMLEVVDIGLDEQDMQSDTHRSDLVAMRDLLPTPLPSDHKYSQGVTGIVAGSDRYPGAAILSVGGALHAKPGLVRYCGTAADAVVGQWPSTIVTSGSPQDAGHVDSWALGPGIGTDEHSLALVREVLAQPVPVVVDADALTLVAEHPKLLTNREHDTLLTPHEGEFRRLAPDVDIEADRIAAASVLAERTGCSVLLKGGTTVIVSPEGDVGLNVSGTPYLATAGTGDVLTGIVAAYCAATLSPYDAGRLGAFVHGLAGRIASDGAPCTAFDVVEAIPDAIHALG